MTQFIPQPPVTTPSNNGAYINPTEFNPQVQTQPQFDPTSIQPQAGQQVVPVTQPQPQQAPAPQAVLPQAGQYDFQVIKFYHKRNVPKSYEGRNYTVDELTLDVVLLGTQDPSNPGQPFRAKIGNINTAVSSLVINSQHGRKVTDFKKVLDAFGITQYPDGTPGNQVDPSIFTGLFANGQVNQPKPHHKNAYINKKTVTATPNPELVAQNQAKLRSGYLTQPQQQY